MSVLVGHPGIRAALKGYDPTPEQLRAIEAPAAPCSVVAGAGSGKTAVMAARLVWLVDQGHAPDTLLGLTFTHKATGELSERVRRALAAMGAVGEPTVSTYHGFADALVALHGERLGLRGARLVSEAQRWQLLLRAADRVPFRELEVRSPETLQSALSLASRLADHLVEPEDLIGWELRFLAGEVGPARTRALAREVERTSRQRIELARLVRAFQEEKQALGLADYDDQIRIAVALAGDPEVAAQVRARWSAVLLDEYQDTNVAQVELVGRLWGDGGVPLLAVGDPQQAIYGWRGATLANLSAFPDRFATAGHLPLPTSFRCDRRIVAVANAVAAGLTKGRGVDLEARPDADEGRVEAFWATDQRAEAEAIAERVAAVLDGGCPPAEVAVLVRSRFPMLSEVRTALDDRGIPVEVSGLGGLLDVPEVVELTSTLRVLADPDDGRHLGRWLLGPQLRIAPGDVARLADHRRARRHDGEVITFVDAVGVGALGVVDGLSADAMPRLQRLVEDLDELRRLVGRPLPSLAEAVLEFRGIWEELAACAEPRAAAARRHLASFLDHVVRFAPFEGEPSLAAFLVYLDAVARDPDEMETILPPSDDAVKLLTIHQAKGLEFDVVFVPGLAARRFPGDRTADCWPDKKDLLPTPLRLDAEYLPDFFSGAVKQQLSPFRRLCQEHGNEEERRVFYVALTRARHHLVVSGASYYGENRKPARPSLFYQGVTAVDGVEAGQVPDEPETSPVLARAMAAAGRWPGAGPTAATDPLFPAGLAAALAGIDARVDALPPERRAAADAEEARLAGLASVLPLPMETAPDSVSVSSLQNLARCPRAYYWDQVRPYPVERSRAMHVGDLVHEEIERRVLGRTPAPPDEPEPEREPEPEPGAGAVEGTGVAGALAAFEASRFATRTPVLVEAPFLLQREGRLIRGRIDAIYPSDDDGWEIVDWKTGPPPGPGDPADGLQMDLYGLAAVDAFGRHPATVTVTTVHLGHGVEHSRSLEASAASARLDALLHRLAVADWTATPGPWCGRCDFAEVCPWRTPITPATRGGPA